MYTYIHIYIGTSCLALLAYYGLTCFLRHYLSHTGKLHDAPLLKNACVRQVVSDKWVPLTITSILYYNILHYNIQILYLIDYYTILKLYYNILYITLLDYTILTPPDSQSRFCFGTAAPASAWRHACMYTFLSLSLYIYIYIYISSVHIYIYIYIYTYSVYIYIYTHTCMRRPPGGPRLAVRGARPQAPGVDACMYVCMNVCMYVCMYVCVCIYIYIYVYHILYSMQYMYTSWWRGSGTPHVSRQLAWIHCRGGCSGRGVQWMGVVLYSETAYDRM